MYLYLVVWKYGEQMMSIIHIIKFIVFSIIIRITFNIYLSLHVNCIYTTLYKWYTSIGSRCVININWFINIVISNWCDWLNLDEFGGILAVNDECNKDEFDDDEDEFRNGALMVFLNRTHLYYVYH
eukprot:868023_1